MYLDFTLPTTLKLIASQLLQDVSSCLTQVDLQSYAGEGETIRQKATV